MRLILTVVALVAVIVAGFSVATAEKQAAQTFEGTYRWNNGGSDELQATFTPKGEGSWDVKFRFRFSGNRSTWDGTAEGRLADGSELTGTAGSSARNWIFSASIEDGVMRGRHTEILRDGDKIDTGTFELAR